MVQTRRQFVRAASGAAATILVAPDAFAGGRRPRLVRGGSFDQGVLSGDPTPRSAVLWTHLDELERAGNVRLEVALDRAFRRVVARRTIQARPSNGYAVKARIKGLRPARRYYYRFETRDEQSPVGRFQTAPPADSRQTVRFAVVSCLEYTFGYYNALALLAREDVDFVINTGDYIYGDVAWPQGIGVRTDPLQEARTLQQYRDKYALYRTDRNLRAVHARFPFINVWDDHEVQNNYAGGDPAGGEVSTPFTVERKNAAYRAFFEVMPTYAIGRSRLYHRASFGRLMDLFVLDERQYRTRQPCGDDSLPECPEAAGDGTALGAAQLRWATRALSSSRATWKVVANEFMIMTRRFGNGNFEDFDSWQGYLRDREALLVAAKEAGDVVFVTGDQHEFIAGDVRNGAGETVASEIVGGSISAACTAELGVILGNPGNGTYENVLDPTHDQRLVNNPEWRYLDGTKHGYFVCEVGADEFRAIIKTVPHNRQPSSAAGPTKTVTVRQGTAGVQV
jgi:alkaline phosphatase D